MSVRIRLRRMGRKKQAHYRIVVADSAAPRDGRFVETLGYYKPLTTPARLVVDLEKADEWIRKGAEQSDTVRITVDQLKAVDPDLLTLQNINQPDDYLAALKSSGLTAPHDVVAKLNNQGDG